MYKTSDTGLITEMQKIYQMQFPSYFEIQDVCTRLGVCIFHSNIPEELSEANHVRILWRPELRL